MRYLCCQRADCRGGADEPRLLTIEPTTTTTTTEPTTRPPRKHKRPNTADFPAFKTTPTFEPTTTTPTTSPIHRMVFSTFDETNKASSVITLSPDLMMLPAATTAVTLPSDTTQPVIGGDSMQNGDEVDNTAQPLPEPPCPAKYLECDSRCLPERYQCDAIPDCSQLEDERNCLSCLPDQVPCPRSRTCVERTRICDGHADCALGEDEEYCVILRNEYSSNTLMSVVDEPPPLNNNVVVTLDALSHTPSAEQGYLLIRQGERYEPVCTNVWTPSLAGAVCRHLQFGQVNFTNSLVEQMRKQMQPQLMFNNFSTAAQQQQQNEPAAALPMPLTYSIYGTKSLIDTLQQIAEHNSPPPPQQRFAELLAYDGHSRATLPAATTCTKVKVTCMEPQCGVIQTGLLTTQHATGQNADNDTIYYYWPWAAALFQNNRFVCTGYTLWNRHWLLLPLHCSRRLQRQTTVVRVGASRLGTTSPYEMVNRLTGYVNHPTLPFLLGRLAEPLRPSVSDSGPATAISSSLKSPQGDVQLHRLICSPQQLLPAFADDPVSTVTNNNSRQSGTESAPFDQIDLIPSNVDECRIVGWFQGISKPSESQREADSGGLIQIISVKLHSQNSCVEQQQLQQRQGRSTSLRKNLRCVEANSNQIAAANKLSCAVSLK